MADRSPIQQGPYVRGCMFRVYGAFKTRSLWPPTTEVIDVFRSAEDRSARTKHHVLNCSDTGFGMKPLSHYLSLSLSIWL